MTSWSDDAATLERLREWLAQVRGEAEQVAAAEPAPSAASPELRPIGLYQLVEEFTVLRQELKLQTKGGRTLQEQTEAGLQAVKEAMEQLRTAQAKDIQPAIPLAEALADLDESLERGRLEIERARRRICDDALGAWEGELQAQFAKLSWWKRRVVRGYHEAAVEVCRRITHDQHRRILDALVEGYGLILSRLQRTLKVEQIQRIACVGRQVDPQCMTVLEVVDDPGRPAGQVIEEVRRGYYYKSRVIRFAEVRAVRGQPAP